MSPFQTLRTRATQRAIRMATPEVDEDFEYVDDEEWSTRLSYILKYHPQRQDGSQFMWRDDGLDRTHAVEMSERTRDRLERNSKRSWDLFYKENSTNFYKDRHYLHKVYPGIISAEEQTTTLLEIGCGVGNAFYPLQDLDPCLRVFAVDLSSEAIELVKSNPSYQNGRCEAFVCDMTKEMLPERIRRPDTVIDNVLLLFVLSAIEPENMLIVIRRACDVLKPGGFFFFRDYGRGDSAQLRFGEGHKIDQHFYARQDGTRAYYFSIEELSKLVHLAGMEIVELEYIKRTDSNRKLGKAWDRVWIHGIFRKRA